MEASAVLDVLADFTLFSDLSRPELEATAHTFDEAWFAPEQRVLRQGFHGTGFHVILEGEASVRIEGEERAKLARGDFFGELSVLLEEPPVADVVALTQLRCLVMPGPQLKQWLLDSPSVTFRMLQAELRRLRTINRWRS